MFTITCPAADTARSAAATYEFPGGNSRSSEVCDTNTRHPPPSPEPSEPAKPIPSTRKQRNQPGTCLA